MKKKTNKPNQTTKPNNQNKSKPRKPHKPFNVCTLHLSNGFVATQLGEMLPNGAYPSHCPVTIHSLSQRWREARQTTVYSQVNAGSSGALHTEQCTAFRKSNSCAKSYLQFLSGVSFLAAI